MAKIFKPKAQKNLVGKIVELNTSRLDLNGDGVAKYQNKTVFVRGALAEETVNAKITEQKAKYLRAQLIACQKESPVRVVPECRHVKQCGGCDLQHLDYQQQLLFKQQKVAELFSRNAHVTELPWQQVLSSNNVGYRRRARIGIQYNKLGQAMVGFRQRSAKHIIAISHCPVLVSNFSDIFSKLEQLINAFTTKQAISHVEVIQTQVSNLVFRLTKKLAKQDLAALETFADENNLDVLLQSDDSLSQLSGQKAKPLTYQLKVAQNNYTFEFNPQDFIQVNADLNEKMVAQALDWLALESSDQVLDLFCGLGNFSLPIASLAQQVIGIEGVQEMVDQAQLNANVNGLTNASFYQADLNSSWLNAAWLSDIKSSITKVILDPARAGALSAVEQLTELDIDTIVYISCDPATLARDSAVLLEHGYQIDRIALMDMFAQTKHIETMVRFHKA